jgi:hypothetical protein
MLVADYAREKCRRAICFSEHRRDFHPRRTRNGRGVGRDFPFVGKKEPRIAKNCKESWACFGDIELMPDWTEFNFQFPPTKASRE